MRVVAALGFIAALVLTGNAPAQALGVKRALLIGIESYGDRGAGWQDLDGPLNDIALVRSVLRDRFQFAEADIRVLDNREATRARIVEAFERLIRETKPGDLVYLHYSGHGATVADANGDEAGQPYDTALVPVDGGPGGSYYILDDEIRLWLSRLLQKTQDVVLVVDACHSGTITRGVQSLKIRRAPVVDSRSYDWSDTLAPRLRELDAHPVPSPRFIRLSACLDSQAAWEYKADDGKSYGRFTWYWCRALLAAKPRQTYGEVFRSAQAMTASVPMGRQEPRLEGAQDVVLFQGTFQDVSTRIAVIGTEGTRVHLSGGVLSGVTPGSVFSRVWSPGAAAPSPVRVKIVEAGAVEATGEIVNGSGLAAGDLLAEVEHRLLFPPLDVAVRGDAVWAGLVRKTVARIQGLRVVDGSGIADLILELSPWPKPAGAVLCEMLDPTEAPFGGGRYEASRLRQVLADTSDVERLGPHLEQLLRCEELLRLAAASQDSLPRVTVEVCRLVPAQESEPSDEVLEFSPGDDVPPALRRARAVTLARVPGQAEWGTLAEGDCLAFRVRNRALGSWYLYVFNLMPSGRLARVFPEAGMDDEAMVKALEVRTFKGSAVQLVDAGQVDTYVCFVTQHPVPLDVLGWGDLPVDGRWVAPTRGLEGTDTQDMFRRWIDGLRDPGLRGGGGGMETGSLATRRFSIRVEGKQR